MKKTCQIKCALLKVVLGMFDSIVSTNNVPYNIVSTNKNISVGVLPISMYQYGQMYNIWWFHF